MKEKDQAMKGYPSKLITKNWEPTARPHQPETSDTPKLKWSYRIFDTCQILAPFGLHLLSTSPHPPSVPSVPEGPHTSMTAGRCGVSDSMWWLWKSVHQTDKEDIRLSSKRPQNDVRECPAVSSGRTCLKRDAWHWLGEGRGCELPPLQPPEIDVLRVHGTSGLSPTQWTGMEAPYYLCTLTNPTSAQSLMRTRCSFYYYVYPYLVLVIPILHASIDIVWLLSLLLYFLLRFL